MKSTTICQGCWEQRHVPIPIRGPLSVLFKSVGIKKSQMHPNLCTICESNFTSVKKQKQISIATTILFADLRGYTSLSQQVDAAKMNTLLQRFYDQCARAVWERDGIVNKFIGDAVLAVFNFPLVRASHAKNAVQAALEIQNNCRTLKTESGLGEKDPVGIGMGIHTGECSIGEVGTAYRDFTVIGSVVNLASRLQGAAAPGEIIVTGEVYRQVKEDYPAAQKKTFSLKGFEKATEGFVIHSSPH